MDGDGGVRQVRQVRLSDEDAIVCQVNQIEVIRWVNQVGEGVRSYRRWGQARIWWWCPGHIPRTP